MLPKLEYYEILGIIGQGGTGIVYDSIDLRSGFRVAVKALYKSRFKDKTIRKKFKEEANLYLYLNHPNIAKLKDFIIKGDQYYLVMEFIEGRTLDEYINMVSGPIPPEKAIPFFCQILDAIAYAHHQNIVHLDIKPSNIMLLNDEKTIKVLDFGIAGTGAAQPEKMMGTPMYMSPEQVSMSVIDRRSDIYSLGATLHQMLTGALPYPSNLTQQELFSRIKNQPLQRLKDLYPALPVLLQEIIDKATRKDPEKRFFTCEEFEMSLIEIN